MFWVVIGCFDNNVNVVVSSMVVGIFILLSVCCVYLMSNIMNFFFFF